MELGEIDVRAIVSILGKSLSGDGDFSEKRSRVLNGIAGLISARSWFWAVTAFDTAALESETPGQPKTTVLDKSGFTEEQFAAYVESQRHPDMAWIAAPLFEACNATEGRVTRHRLQMHPREALENSEVNDLFVKAGMGPIIISQKKKVDNSTAVIAFCRPSGAEEFDARETKIAHIILSEIEWLHENSWPEYPETQAAMLSVRLTSILNLLLEGDPRKMIAQKLGLSEYTVSDYVKAIYKHFDVHSHTELILRFTKGDGGDGLT